MTVNAACLKVPDDPRVRPARNVLRGLREAARLVEAREAGDMRDLVARCKAVLAGRRLRAFFQPVVDIRKSEVVGYEALIRGPKGSPLEAPDILFAAAEDGEMGVELENACLETIFARLPRAVRTKRLFVNASARLLTHSVFLDDRNLNEIRRAHPDVVMEVSEKEVVEDYASFREVLGHLREAGFRVAIDDAGSGYSGLESILQMRPEYIKVAETIVRSLDEDMIKREMITALASLGRRFDAAIIAEGIERPEELKALLDLGVGYGQGYLLGRPAPRVAAA
jgi:EAL domain-containing protein (putative c-di-GMP-specific phosphodiesterase class I)